MPVPKKRLGHSDQQHRRSNWKATVPTVTRCTNCGTPRLSHTVCTHCGFYHGRIVTSRFEHAHHGHEGHDHD